MGLKKGQTGNPNGRPKGVQNKVTREVKGWLSGLIDKNRKQIEKDLKALEPKDRLLIIEKFMQYTIPKMQSVQAQIDFSRLSDEQLDNVINELAKGLEDDYTNSAD
jgi:uncharacterized protein (UPF0305 family)